MNKNKNMLIMIGIVTLACGQLYGLSPRQLAKLRRFETQLKERFAGRPERGQEGAWLEENRRIIGEIRRLDRPTAAEYQRRQDDFSGEIKAERARAIAEAETAQIIAALEREKIEAEAEAAQIIVALEKKRTMEEAEAAQKIAALERERKQEREAARIEEEARVPEEVVIAAEEIGHAIIDVKADIVQILAASPVRLTDINFSRIPLAIEKVRSIIAEKLVQFPQADFNALENEIDKLQTELANALIKNLKRLFKPTVEELGVIVKYISMLQGAKNPFNFDENQIKNPINNLINKDLILDKIFQGGLLLDHLKNADMELMRNAETHATYIANAVDQLLIVAYIKKLNRLSEEKKKANELTVVDFNATARAIQTMKWVIAHLYGQLQDGFGNDDVRLIDLTENINARKSELSNLKRQLYDIYGVKSGASENTIKILYSKFDPAEGKMFLGYSDEQADPLTDIPPTPKRRIRGG